MKIKVVSILKFGNEPGGPIGELVSIDVDWSFTEPDSARGSFILARTQVVLRV